MSDDENDLSPFITKSGKPVAVPAGPTGAAPPPSDEADLSPFISKPKKPAAPEEEPVTLGEDVKRSAVSGAAAIPYWIAGAPGGADEALSYMTNLGVDAARYLSGSKATKPVPRMFGPQGAVAQGLHWLYGRDPNTPVLATPSELEQASQDPNSVYSKIPEVPTLGATATRPSQTKIGALTKAAIAGGGSGAATALFGGPAAMAGGALVGGGGAAAQEFVHQNMPAGYEKLEVPIDFAAALLGGKIAGRLGAAAGLGEVEGTALQRARLAASRRMADEGVELTPAQQTGAEDLGKAAETEVGGARALSDNQKYQFVRAAGRRAGINLDNENAIGLTDDVINRAHARIGAVMDGIEYRNPFVPPPADLQTMINEIDGAAADYNLRVAPGMRSGEVNRAVDNIYDRLTGGTGQPVGQMTGADYRWLRNDLGQAIDAARGSGVNPADSRALDAFTRMRDALEDTYEQGITNQRDLRDLETARDQYRNLMTLSDAMKIGSKDGARGLFTPSQLANAVGRRSKAYYVRGRDQDLNTLMKDGQQTMETFPDSGTATRVAARALFAIPSAYVGYKFGAEQGFGPTAQAGAAFFAARAADKAVKSTFRALISSQNPAARAARAAIVNEHYNRLGPNRALQAVFAGGPWLRETPPPASIDPDQGTQ